MEALQGLLKRVGDIMEFNTALLHRGFEIDKKTGAILTPIYQVSAFSQESAEQLEKVFNNKATGFAPIQWQTVLCCRFQEQQRWLRDTQPLLQRLRVAKGHHSYWQEQQRLPSVRGFYGFPLCRNSRNRSW